VSLRVFCVISRFPYFIKVVAQTEGKSDAQQQQLPFKFYVTQGDSLNTTRAHLLTILICLSIHSDWSVLFDCTITLCDTLNNNIHP
jgi:hypothetical protein